MRNAFFGLLLLLCSALASAQTRINLMYIYTPGAVRYLESLNRTVDSNAPALTVRVNEIFANTNVQFDTVKAFDATARCCGDAKTLYSVPATEAHPEMVGAVRWVQRDIEYAAMRDFYKADIVVVVGNYDLGTPTAPLDFKGVSLSNCGSSVGAIPENGYVGIHIASQLSTAQGVILAHELGHQLCMDEATGWYKKTGSTPGDCEVRWSAEYADFNTTYPSYTYPLTLWDFVQNAHAGYTSAQAACNGAAQYIKNHVQGGSGTQGFGVLSGNTCAVYYNNGALWGSQPVFSYSGGQATGGSFICENAVNVPYFAGSGPPPGQYGGTTMRNTIAAMNTQAALTAGFRNTRLAPALIAKAIRAAVVTMFTLP